MLPIACNQHSCTGGKTTINYYYIKQTTTYNLITGDMQQAVTKISCNVGEVLYLCKKKTAQWTGNLIEWLVDMILWVLFTFFFCNTVDRSWVNPYEISGWPVQHKQVQTLTKQVGHSTSWLGNQPQLSRHTRSSQISRQSSKTLPTAQLWSMKHTMPN